MKFIFTLLYIACSTYTMAQYVERENNKSDTARTSYLDEMVVSANRIPEQRRTIAQQIKVMGPGVIANLNVQNSADLLTNSGVVAIQKSQQGGGSPMLRGFEASRVLLVIDGVRMNNAMYRAGHLQNIITTDNTILDRAEILFGPSSTVYGSDALGGVIHFYTRNPEFSTTNKPNFKSKAFLRYGSVNAEKTGHADFSIGTKKMGSLTSFTFSDFGDLRMGRETNPTLGKQFGIRTQYAVRTEDNQSDVLINSKDRFLQKFSGYKQYDMLQKFLFTQSDRIKHLLNFQYSTSSDIPRYDRLTEKGSGGAGLKFAEWYYGPQKRLMGSYQLTISDLGSMADGLTATVSYQNVEESRHDRRFTNNNRNNRIEQIQVGGLTVELNKAKGKNSLRYGIDGQFNTLNSTAHVTNIVTKTKSLLDTRYPDGDNTMSSLATFVTHTLRFSDVLTLNDGVRFGGSWLSSTFENKTFFPFPYNNIKQNTAVYSGNLGIIYTPTSWKFSWMSSTGFRVPNIDDLTKVFESAPGDAGSNGKLIVPNPELKPEKTINLDASITKFFGDKLRLETVLFVTRFYDAIAIRPSTFNGQSVIDYGGFPADIFTNQNVGKAILYGYSASLRADLSSAWVIVASYNYTHGEVINRGDNIPLDHIAPIFGRIGVQYQSEKFNGELFSNFSGWKYSSRYSLSGEDNQQYAPTDGMPSWYTINIRASYDISTNLKAQLGVDNILDLQYRTFASGINAPGRNISVTLRVRI